MEAPLNLIGLCLVHEEQKIAIFSVFDFESILVVIVISSHMKSYIYQR